MASSSPSTNKTALNRRFERTSWALLLIMIGGFLIAGDAVPGGSWLLGVGVILIGLNLARSRNGIKPPLITTILGVVALALGVGNFFGIGVPILPALLVLVGLNILMGVWTKG
jgi:hypothetical protein